jgi:hypothetical protein
MARLGIVPLTALMALYDMLECKLRRAVHGPVCEALGLVHHRHGLGAEPQPHALPLCGHCH